MKTEFYNKTKRQSIYSSVFIYKIISLCILAVLTCIMAVLFHKYKTMYHEYTDEATPVLFLFMAACLVIFVISIFLDIYILKKTVSIGQRLSKLAYIDKLTGLPNRYSCDLLLDSFSDPSTLEKTGFLLLRLNNLVTINADNGHDNGNHLISAFANILEDTASDYGYAGRNGGNEFVVLMENCDNTKAEMFLMDLTKKLNNYNETNQDNPIEVAYAKALNENEHKEKISELISLGYQRIREIPQILS